MVAVLRTAGAGSSPIGLRNFLKMQFSESMGSPPLCPAWGKAPIPVYIDVCG